MNCYKLKLLKIDFQSLNLYKEYACAFLNACLVPFTLSLNVFLDDIINYIGDHIKFDEYVLDQCIAYANLDTLLS